MDKGEGRGGGAIKTAFDTSDEYQPDEHNGRPLTLEYQPEGKTIIIVRHKIEKGLRAIYR